MTLSLAVSEKIRLLVLLINAGARSAPKPFCLGMFHTRSKQTTTASEQAPNLWCHQKTGLMIAEIFWSFFHFVSAVRRSSSTFSYEINWLIIYTASEQIKWSGVVFVPFVPSLIKLVIDSV